MIWGLVYDGFRRVTTSSSPESKDTSQAQPSVPDLTRQCLMMS